MTRQEDLLAGLVTVLFVVGVMLALFYIWG